MVSLSDVFRPLFEVTKDPSTHPELHVFLQRVIGFDTVDDESKVERRIHRKFPFPRLWDFEQSPPYSYWFVDQCRYALFHIYDLSFQGLLHVC
jgi:AMP deaminase